MQIKQSARQRTIACRDAFHVPDPRVPALGARRLLACNIAILVAGVALALVSAIPLYGDALAAKPDHAAVAIYLAIMAGGSAFMIVVATGGLLRNLALFPVSKRKGS